MPSLRPPNIRIPDSSTMPLPKEISPSLEISKTIEQEIKNQLPGELLINLPNEMTLGVKERAEIRIAKKGIKNFNKGLRARGTPEIENIKISPIMKVRLIGDKFDIEALSHEVQPITDFDITQWEWNITPREAGNQSLEISISLRIAIPQLNEWIVKDYPVYEKEVKVKVNKLEIVKFLLIGVMLLIVLWVLSKNRRKLTAWIKRKKLKRIPFKSVRIILENGNLKTGFSSITVQIWADEDKLPTQYSAKLLPAPEIIELYNCWQLRYNLFIEETAKISRMQKKPVQVTNASEFNIAQLSTELQEKLNQWLNAKEFLPINYILRERLKGSDEIQVIIQSENIDVRRLPWHLWDFLKPYRKAEIALSSPFYDRTLKTPVTRNKTRILSILGDDKGINLDKDRQFLAKIDAETAFIVKPNLQQLNEQLWSEQGWDILCFSGHSSSEMDGSNGYIYINDTDKLTIPELKNALRTAIERGLQIAIFNSCDGLGLANQLASLHIPQIIVMREPVPDIVAQEFLKNFLTAFASGKSFYLAVREAREKLQWLEKDFPCASWLPVICQNPAEIPPTWESLRRTLS
ncbi:CHAT domain-containing protein [Aerosakkonemataceae cyanobacterium BLCC-F50]|uniref:CHAT domain-containing protein n=1 Tax=Floridaenema flaviceps BLCC-F50 TaxID=3153642 RepID=A0ABV4XIY2_9CYAN